MTGRDVVFSPEARADLIEIYEYIADRASETVALAYIERIEAYLRGFDLVAERGSRRDDIRPGLRIVGFERRVTIAFMIKHPEIIVLRIFYGGRDWRGALGEG